MFNECELHGQSGRCNIYDCSVFSSGDCKDPGMVLEYELEGNQIIPQDVLEDIFESYPELTDEYQTKKEEVMTESKIEMGLNVQIKDRKDVSVKLMTAVDRLTKGKPVEQVFFKGEHEEVFSETIHVPVKVVCVESNGERRVYFNAFQANGTHLMVLASKELISCLGKLSEKVSDRDSDLGCENLSELL